MGHPMFEGCFFLIVFSYLITVSPLSAGKNFTGFDKFDGKCPRGKKTQFDGMRGGRYFTEWFSQFPHLNIKWLSAYL